jgi:hypothetical protein
VLARFVCRISVLSLFLLVPAATLAQSAEASLTFSAITPGVEWTTPVTNGDF